MNGPDGSLPHPAQPTVLRLLNPNGEGFQAIGSRVDAASAPGGDELNVDKFIARPGWVGARLLHRRKLGTGDLRARLYRKMNPGPPVAAPIRRGKKSGDLLSAARQGRSAVTIDLAESPELPDPAIRGRVFFLPQFMILHLGALGQYKL